MIFLFSFTVAECFLGLLFLSDFIVAFITLTRENIINYDCALIIRIRHIARVFP